MSEIKICGLFRDCDIDYVNEAEPEYAGFIIDFPKSHRSLDPDRAAVLRSSLKPGIRAVGVFVDKSIESVCTIADMTGIDVIQLHGHEDEAYIKAIGKSTSRPVWKAFKISESRDMDRAKKSPANMILLDNGYGTGRAFDWSLISGVERPFILAGGLTPDNIHEALRGMSPDIIDISSGVETHKLKDREKIIAAVRAAHGC